MKVFFVTSCLLALFALCVQAQVRHNVVVSDEESESRTSALPTVNTALGSNREAVQKVRESHEVRDRQDEVARGRRTIEVTRESSNNDVDISTNQTLPEHNPRPRPSQTYHYPNNNNNNNNNHHHPHHVHRRILNESNSAPIMLNKPYLDHAYLVDQNSLSIEVYRIILFNQSIVQRLNRVSHTYCNITNEEEKLALYNSCDSFQRHWWVQKCFRQVLGDNPSYTSKRDLLCNRSHHLIGRWVTCNYHHYFEMHRRRKDYRFYSFVLGIEMPYVEHNLNVIRHYASIRANKINSLVCKEQALGISSPDYQPHNESSIPAL